MRTIFIGKSKAKLQRAVKATVLALVIAGGGCTWQHIASERIAERAEEARLAALRMTPRKLEALRHESNIAAAARAHALRDQADKQVQARRAAEDTAPTTAPPPVPLRKG